MADLTLYHSPMSRSSDVLWILEEIGEPYDVHLLNTGKGANRQPDYLAVNPMGKVPALRHADAIITETAQRSQGNRIWNFFGRLGRVLQF
jgi:glutathione S-transferase